MNEEFKCSFTREIDQQPCLLRHMFGFVTVENNFFLLNDVKKIMH